MRHFFEAVDAGQYDTHLIVGYVLMLVAVCALSVSGVKNRYKRVRYLRGGAVKQRTEVIDNHTVIFEDETVVAIQIGNETFQVGQRVVANGHIFVKAGTEGVIVAISAPNNFDTTDLLRVQFPGRETPDRIKPRDLVRQQMADC